MRNKIKKTLVFLIPIIVLQILNCYIISFKNMSNTTKWIRAFVILLVYSFIYYLVNSKNKYFNFERIHKIRYYIFGIIFVLLVMFKFHGSSIKMWDKYYSDYGGNAPKTTYFGKARAIRSDEWLVQTPLYLSQEIGEGHLSRINKNIRSDGQDTILSSYGPAVDITTLGKPCNWGFLFLGPERGLSWYWNSKLLGIIILSYEMILILAKRNRSIAFIGSMLISFASASQWWFSSVLDLIILSQALVVSVYYYLRTNKLHLKIINTILFISSAIGFVISLYPPIQVSLGYLTLIFLIYVVLSQKQKIRKRDLVVFICSTLFIVSVIFYFVYSAKDAMKLLMSTVYPGARFISGGSGDINSFSNYIIGWLLPYKDSTFSNNSEISGYIGLIPVVIMLFAIRNRNDKNNKLIVASFVYLCVMCSFVLFKYPVIISKITLFYFIPETRMAITIGLLGTYILCMLLADFAEKKVSVIKASIITFISLCVMFIPMMHTEYYSYLKRNGMIMSILIFGIVIYFLVKGYIKQACAYVAILMLLTGLTVNPICRGLAPIYEKSISKEIRLIDKNNPGKWAFLDSLEGGDFIKANGVRVFNGTNFYPDLKMWRKLDQERKYNTVYNRYAHIIVTIVDEKTSFELVSPDTFRINLNIQDIDKTGVKYFMGGADLEKYNKNNKVKFKKLYYNYVDKVYIYEYAK